MKKVNASFLVNTLPILAIIVVFAIVFDWGHAIGIFFRERKIDSQKAYLDDIKYDIKIDKIEASSSGGKIDDEYLLINSTMGNAFYVRYTYDESKKKTNLEEYKNYDIRRCVIGFETSQQIQNIISGNKTTLDNTMSESKSAGDYGIYQNDKLKKVVSKNDTESIKVFEEIKQSCKAITNL